MKMVSTNTPHFDWRVQYTGAAVLQQTNLLLAMELEGLLSNKILDLLWDDNDGISADIELLLAKASDLYKSPTDSTSQPGSTLPQHWLRTPPT